MKARGLLLIDFEFPGFKEAAKMEEQLEATMNAITKDNPFVVHQQMSLKERRGDAAPDLDKMKFRQN